MSITASEARKRLLPLIRDVNENAQAIEIVATDARAFLVSAAEYESWMETAYLLRSPANARRLRASIADAKAGTADAHDLDNPDAEAWS